MDGDAGTRAAAHRNLRRETDKAKAAVVCLLRALRGPRESHSDVILRLAKASSWQARTVAFDLRMNLGHSDRPPALSRREGPAAVMGVGAQFRMTFARPSRNWIRSRAPLSQTGTGL